MAVIMTKLAAAKDWRNRPIETWNVVSFTEYLKDEHKRIFGVDYAPMRSWGLEQSALGDLIGTQSRKNPKPRTASNASVKAFIDECFATYTPTAAWPGTSFGFSWSYRKNVWQRLQLEEQRKAAASKAETDQAVSWDELHDWL